jgi:hypothetical protein
MDRTGTKTYQHPALLVIALQRAVEKEGFDVIFDKVKNEKYARAIVLDTYKYDLPFAFMWRERINQSDTSTTVQLLFNTLREKGNWFLYNQNLTRVFTQGLSVFNNHGGLSVCVHDHNKTDILAMLEELKPMKTRIINSIWTNSNTGPL